jgi:hypothetical protein
MPSTRAYAGHVGHRDVDAVQPQGTVGMLAGPRHLPSPLGERRQVLDKEDRQRIASAEACGQPAKLLPGRGAPRSRGRIAHVDAAASHRRHVRREVVALHPDVAEPTAARQVFGEPRVGASGSDRSARVAQAQQLEVVVLLEGDRVVGCSPGMGAARVDVESDARVGVDAAREVRDADHDVVDTGQHSCAPRRVFRFSSGYI